MSAAPSAQAIALDADSEIVRKSVRLRCERAFVMRWLLSLVLVVMAVLLWNEELSRSRLVAWFGLTLLAFAQRVRLCRKVIRRVDAADASELQVLQRKLFWNTIPLNVAMGAGVWWVAAVSSPEIQLFVTLALCFYAIGTAINLSSHAPSFELALSCNLGQCIAFWLLQGAEGIKISVLLIATAYLLISLGRTNQRAFADSVRMQFENLELIAQLGREKAAVEKALATVEAASHSKSTFLAAASHDLRQPLHALSFYMAALSTQVREDKPQQLVGKIRETIFVLESLFGNLLDLARFDTGNVQPQVQTFDVDSVLQYVDRAYRPVAEVKGLRWTVSSAHIPVTTDAVLLQRVLGNLADNAIKYTDAGGVQISVEAEAAHVRIAVEDSGRGIRRDELERIFDEFYQLQNPGRRREGGVGLGLSIVRRIDRLLRLDLEVHSEVGRGTRFVMRVLKGPERIDAVPLPERGAGASASVYPKLGLRVWVLDDDTTVRDALASQLEQWGCVASCIPDEPALHSVSRAEGRWPDALIADDMLGSARSGLDVARDCAKYLDKSRITIMTGASLPRRLEEIRSSGFHLMCKPASPEALYEHLKQIAAMID